MSRLDELTHDFAYEIVEDVQGRPLRVGGEMQLADQPNLNRRKYPESLWRRVLESGKTKSRLSERRMIGLLDHPGDGKSKLAWPGPSHVMTNLEMRESKRFPGVKAVYGVYECLPTPSGKVLEALLRSRVGVQVSSRGDGDLEESGDGTSTVIPESYDLDTFDVVIDPSVNTDVRVLEANQSAPPGVKFVKEDKCSCEVPQGKTSEAIVKAIHGIVESGNYDESCRKYYTQVLEHEVDQYHLNRHLGSEAYLMADEALSTLRKEDREVTTVKQTETPLAEAQASTTIEQLRAENARITSELAGANKKLEAATKTVEALLVQSRNFKMQFEHNLSKLKALGPVQELYDQSKLVIVDLREAVKQLEHESELRMAAEQLLGAMLTRVDEAKRRAYIERLLVHEDVKVRENLRPVLYRCESKRAVNESFKAYKHSITEGRRSRGLPPVNENARRRMARISPTSPIMETRGTVHTGEVRDGKGRNENGDQPRLAGQTLDEQVNFTKRVMKASRS